jgi:hypothetical protein
MLQKTIKKSKHIQPFERLARHVIIRGWLDTIGHGVLTSWTPIKKIKQEAEDWIGTDEYYNWCEIAGLEKDYADRLYTNFKIGYSKGVWKKENPHSTLMHLFEII